MASRIIRLVNSGFLAVALRTSGTPHFPRARRSPTLQKFQLGLITWKSHFPKLFGGYETVYVVGDNDVKEDGSNPGAEFSKRVANEVMNSTIVTLPPNMDINDYYLAHGAEATRKLLIGESSE